MSEDLDFLLDNDNKGSEVKTLRNRMFLGKYVGVFYDGSYYPYTNQISFTIAFKTNINEDVVIKTKTNIEKLIEKMKPLKDGNIHFKIMEASLSEFGSYDLILTEDKEWKIQKTTHYVTKIVKTGELMELLNYIKEVLFLKE